jgi:DNA-directed RNA polymerase subunit RPC12/RpoP
MKFELLDIVQQPLVLRKVLAGKKPTIKIKDKEGVTVDTTIELPRVISMIYICHDCKRVRNVTVYTIDFTNTQEIIKCSECGGQSRRSNFGTETMLVLSTTTKTKKVINLNDFFMNMD